MLLDILSLMHICFPMYSTCNSRPYAQNVEQKPRAKMTNIRWQIARDIIYSWLPRAIWIYVPCVRICPDAMVLSLLLLLPTTHTYNLFYITCKIINRQTLVFLAALGTKHIQIDCFSTASIKTSVCRLWWDGH